MYRFLTIIFLLIISNIAISQGSTGLIPIEKFTSENFGAQAHCFAIAQDDRGAIYVGNKDGLLVYTGIWRNYITNNATEIRSLAVGLDGNIYIGNQNGFGYFTPSDTGNFIYYPLDTLLAKEQQQKVENTQIVLSNDSAIYFVADKYLYKYFRNSIKTIALQEEVNSMIILEGKILIQIKNHGLFELQNDELVAIPNNKRYFATYKGKREFTIGPLQPLENNKIIYLTKNTTHSELRILDLATGEDHHFNTQVDTIIKNSKIKSLLNINNKILALRINNKGLILIDFAGKFIRKVDNSSNLQSDVIENMFADNNNILWTAHKTGISRVDVFSNYEYIPNEKLGIKNAIEDIKYFNDTLFLAMQDHLSYFSTTKFTNNKQLSIEDIDKLSNPKCVAINNPLSLGKGCYGLLNFESGDYKSLLFITMDNIMEKRIDGSIDTAYRNSGYKLFQDLKDPNRIWISLFPRGLASIYYDNGKWIDEGNIENTSYQIFDINADKDNNIWMGTYGLLQLKSPKFVNHKISKPEIIQFDTTNNLSLNDAYTIYRENDNIFFASADGLYEYNSDDNLFIRSNHFGEWMERNFTFRFSNDKEGKTWAVCFPKDLTKVFIKSFTPNSEGTYFSNHVYSKKGKAQKFLSIFPYDGGVIAAGNFSMVKINNHSEHDTIKGVEIFINRIEKTGKKILFGGTFTNNDGRIVNNQNKTSVPTLDYNDNNLAFDFSGISSKVTSEVEYRWWLEGNDENWEIWNNKREVRFTNLHEGNYTFWVQARDIYGNESKKLSYSFSVNPPWNRTIWAYISYLILLGLFVWGAIQYSTRKLKLIITEATAEIQEQKNDIEHKNEEIVSSIRYAQRIQEAVVPNDKQMQKAFPNHFVLWKPRDIVSGDYYWMMEKGGKIILAAADCTGHGVPGAFMSIMGISFLNEIANNPTVQTAASALDLLRQNVITSLNQEGSETNTKDGMDMSICVYDFKEMTMEFAGAYNPMYMIRDGELSTVKADRMPIGIHDRDNIPFTNIKFDLHKGDIFYILSDGFIDQFGGPKGKKYMTKRFKKLLLEIYEKPMADQKEILWRTLLEWRGDIEQLDDIIVIGVRV